MIADPAGFLRGDLTTDGIHLNASGYKIWRDSLAPYLSQVCLTDHSSATLKRVEGPARVHE